MSAKAFRTGQTVIYTDKEGQKHEGEFIGFEPSINQIVINVKDEPVTCYFDDIEHYGGESNNENQNN